MSTDLSGVAKNCANVGLIGVVGGFSSDVLTHPLDVMKYHQQVASTHLSVRQVAKTIIARNGMRGFYSGFTPRIMNRMIKKAWTWNMVFYSQDSI